MFANMIVPRLFIFFASIQCISAINLLSPTPPMGFNNWARFQCALNETLFTTTADFMSKSGLLAAGYNRINLDDCWELKNRTSKNELQWDPVKFPHGIPWLAKYVKKLGFHLGIYSDAGNMTCGGYPGSLGYEDIDAKTFASWGIDYLKLDGCNVPVPKGMTLEGTYKQIYSKWHSILSKLADPMIFSESAPAYFAPWMGVTNLSDWYSVMNWVPKYGELARHSNDIMTYDSGGAWDSIMVNYQNNLLFARYQEANHGFWNDPDFLIVDHWELTLDEKKSQFALWCSMGAPLIISADVPNLKKEELEYLTNKDLIAVDQDSLGMQATLVSQDGTWDVLTRNLSNGDRLVTVLNRGAKSGTISIDTDRLGLFTYCNGTYADYKIKDLWTGKSKTVTTVDGIKTTVPAHGTAVFRVTLPTICDQPNWPTGLVFNTASFNCLTGNHNPLVEVSFRKCNGSDSQVWSLNPEGGRLRTQDDGTRCLIAMPGDGTANGTVYMNRCEGKGVQRQKWHYDVNGNLKNGFTKGCLTEAAGGKVVMSECGNGVNEQVFGMPSGSVGI
ncbi:alpha-galactosidase A [Tricladium varicosporioides]|nr:alpha-galactosidase A [Hymenoscyphus varicosporioides]